MMNRLENAARQALEALEYVLKPTADFDEAVCQKLHDTAITGLREALAEQVQDLEHNEHGQACTPTYAYSLNGENYTAAEGDTREAALHEGQAEACEEREPGDKVTIYTGVEQTPFDVLRKQAENIGAHLIESLEERAADEIQADDLIIFVQPSADAALGNLVIDWIEKNATARYFAVDDVQKHDYTVEGDTP